MVQCEGFKDLVEVLEPRYTMVSRQKLQHKLIPNKVSEIVTKIKSSIQNTNFCSLTLDIWSSRRMHGYLGVTCRSVGKLSHIFLLVSNCLDLTMLKIFLLSIIDEFDIELKVFKVVTDSASNMKKAFQVSLPEFALDSEEEDEDDGAAEIEESLESSEISEDIFDTVPERISCFAHTLQLSIKDSINASQQATKAIAKVAKIVNHIKKSTKSTEMLESLFHKMLVSKNETRWNSQLKMVRRAIELDTNEVIAKRELHLSNHEKSILQEFVDIFEPFEDATDILQGENYVSICLVIPTYIGLMKGLQRLKKAPNTLVFSLQVLSIL